MTSCSVPLEASAVITGRQAVACFCSGMYPGTPGGAGSLLPGRGERTAM